MKQMNPIRPAKREDLIRIAEIEIFNYRLNFYPIFQNDTFYFGELQVSRQTENYKNALDSLRVYDDGVVKGFIQAKNREVKKLFTEPVLQGNGIGAKLLGYAIAEMDAKFLWALKKNVRAISFYKRHGFRVTGEKKFEEGTTETLVRLER